MDPRSKHCPEEEDGLFFVWMPFVVVSMLSDVEVEAEGRRISFANTNAISSSMRLTLTVEIFFFEHLS